MIKSSLLTVLIASIAMTFSCTTTPRGDVSASPTASGIRSASERVGKSLDRAEDRTGTISEQAEAAEQPDIVDEASRLKTDIQEAQEANQEIQARVPSVADSEAELDYLKREGAAEAKKDLFGILKWLFGLGALAVIGGAVLGFFNARLGMMVAGIGLLTTAIAAAGTYYMQWLALIGFVIVGIGLLTTVGFLAYGMWKGRVYRSGMSTNTEIIEMVKQDLPDEKKKQIFGDKAIPGVAEQRQSRAVQKEIGRQRKKLKKKIEPTIRTD